MPGGNLPACKRSPPPWYFAGAPLRHPGFIKLKTIARINVGNIGFCWSWICFKVTFLGGAYKNHLVKVRMTSKYLETPWFPVKILYSFLPQRQLEQSPVVSLFQMLKHSLKTVFTEFPTRNPEPRKSRHNLFLTLTEWFLRLNRTRTKCDRTGCCIYVFSRTQDGCYQSQTALCL